MDKRVTSIAKLMPDLVGYANCKELYVLLSMRLGYLPAAGKGVTY